jgi:hypothetical protein
MSGDFFAKVGVEVEHDIHLAALDPAKSRWISPAPGTVKTKDIAVVVNRGLYIGDGKNRLGTFQHARLGWSRLPSIVHQRVESQGNLHQETPIWNCVISAELEYASARFAWGA